MGDGCGTLTRLIGEEPSVDSPGHCDQDGAHPGTGDTGRGIERLAEDGYERRDHIPEMHENDEQRSQHINGSHQRSQDARDAPDARDASQNH